jgi:hypothetical protein
MTLLDGCNGNADQGVAREFQQRGLFIQSVFLRSTNRIFLTTARAVLDSRILHSRTCR